jgi:hypothetical protein
MRVHGESQIFRLIFFFEFFFCPALFHYFRSVYVANIYIHIHYTYIFNTYVAVSNIYFKLIYINYPCLTFVHTVIEVA